MEIQPQKSSGRYSSEEKQQIIGQWKQSGMSRLAFCRQHNMSYYTLMYWTKKKRVGNKKVASGFIPLEVKSRSDQACSEHSGALGLPKCRTVFAQIETGGKRLLLYQPVKAVFLKQLMS